MSAFALQQSLKGVSASACLAVAVGVLGSGAFAQGAAAPSLSASSFTSDFSAMAQLKTLASQGKGKIGVCSRRRPPRLAIRPSTPLTSRRLSRRRA